ncbi:hypothetical protein QJS04_geneDACA000749 [Acorus gramineus]|uniref:Uncharacterized protein n=1 Tax=Acorus gramineus TaxID=55184 RepID=A0AAV9BJN4_ACOGR|nr:hypothetical protein QJS04_geneDACA000749 [Acorus gramineus]
MEDPLLSPSQSTNTTTTISTSSIIIRIASVIAIAAIAVWANHEASKGFKIVLSNESGDSAVGHRFDLRFVSNDKAIRAILNATAFAERLLYPDESQFPPKPVRRVTLRLARTEPATTGSVSVEPGEGPGEFVISMGPSVMRGADEAVASAVHYGVARVFLYEMAGMEAWADAAAECVRGLAGFGARAGSDDVRVVSRLLGYCEGQWAGFLARLNQAVRDGWAPRENASGAPDGRLCESYLYSMSKRRRRQPPPLGERQVL